MVLLVVTGLLFPVLLLFKSPKKEEVPIPQEPPVNYEEKFRQVSVSLAELQEYFNRATDIINKDKFTLETDYIPIVIYVYRRPYYLEKVPTEIERSNFFKVLQALSNVQGIEKTIIVVSHDSTMPEMLDLVRNVTFCQVNHFNVSL